MELEMIEIPVEVVRRTVLAINVDRTYDLEVVKRFLDDVERVEVTEAVIRFNIDPHELDTTSTASFCKELTQQDSFEGPKIYDLAIFVLNANESRLNINEEGSGVGFYDVYQTLREVTGDHVLVIIGQDGDYKCGDPISSQVRNKIAGQFTDEYIYGPKGWILSWDDRHTVAHIDSLLKYLNVTRKSTIKNRNDGSNINLIRSDQQPLLAVLIGTMLMFYIATVVFYILGNTSLGKDIYLNTTAEVFDAYFLEITPGPWIFAFMWIVIYIWIAIGLVYAMASLIRKRSENKPLYTDYQLINTPFCLLILLNLICNVTWISVWAHQVIDWSLVPMALIPFTLYLCLGISFHKLIKHSDSMHRDGNNKDIWMTILFVQNGIAFYATWTTFTTLLNFAIMLTYRANVSQDSASIVSVSILYGEILIWFVLESAVLDRWVRYTFSQYIVVLVALGGSVAKNWNPNTMSSIMTGLVITAAGLMAVVKIILVIYRHRTAPLFGVSHNNI